MCPWQSKYLIVIYLTRWCKEAAHYYHDLCEKNRVELLTEFTTNHLNNCAAYLKKFNLVTRFYSPKRVSCSFNLLSYFLVVANHQCLKGNNSIIQCCENSCCLCCTIMSQSMVINFFMVKHSGNKPEVSP